MISLFGKDAIDPAFKVVADLYGVISVGDPGLSQIYEFNDGKIMLPYIEDVMDFNWERLTRAVDIKALKAILAQCVVVALGYWSLTPAFDELVTNLCGLLEEGAGKRLFFDFADIRKKDGDSLRKTLALLASLNGKFPMTLSLNEHEAALLFSFLDEPFDMDGEETEYHIDNIRKRIGLDEVIVHTPHWSAGACVRDGGAVVIQDFCHNPVITAGAGDNFNAGYLAAHLASLNLREKLAAGNAAAYFYLSNGFSPDRAELIDEMKRIRKVLYGRNGL